MADEMNIEIIVDTHNANGEVKKLERQISELKGAVSKASQKGLEIKVDNSVKSIAEVIKMVDKLQGALEEVNRKYAKNKNNAANKQAAAEIREKTKAEKEANKQIAAEMREQQKILNEISKAKERNALADIQEHNKKNVQRIGKNREDAMAGFAVPQYVSYNQQLHALNEEAQKFHQQMRKGIVTNGDYQRSLAGINMQAAAIRKEMKEMPMLLNQSGTYLGSFAQKFR